MGDKRPLDRWVGAKVAQAWGFEPKSIHTWNKTTNDGNKLRIGVGHYGRNCTEHVLVCKSPKAKSWTYYGLRDIPTSFSCPRGHHSQKPEEWNRVALRLAQSMGGRMLEMFAREEREWFTWGAESL